MHEGKIAELNLKLKEEELLARMAIKNDHERRAEAVDVEPREEREVSEGESPANETLVEEQRLENDDEQLPLSDADPIPPALTEASEIFADNDTDEIIYKPDLRDEGEPAFDVGDAGPYDEDGGSVIADARL